MNSLNGRLVIIVLSVQEGRGFDRLKHPLYLEANLNGRRIESDVVDATSSPLFATELVWETEKKEVRKLRSSHIPLRIECISIHNTDNREKLGFILLNLRSAQPILASHNGDFEYKWHKLIGVSGELKQSKPELRVSLTIRDREYKEIVPPCVPIIDQTILEEGITYELEKDNSNISVSLIEEGYIQIGPNRISNEIFLLNLIIGTVYNLDVLLQEDAIFRRNDSKYCICLTIFDISLNTKYFYKDLHQPIVLNDRFVLKLQADLDILRSFFGQFTDIKLHFMKNETSLATADLNLKYFDTEDLFEETNLCNYDVNCAFVPSQKTSVIVTDRKPFVNIEIVIEKSFSSSDLPKITDDPGSKFLDNGAGDMSKCHKSTDMNEFWCRLTENTSQTSAREIKMAVTQISVSHENPLQIIPRSDNENYKIYKLTSSFKSITWRKPLNIDGFRFNFHHPKAKTVLMIHCNSEYIIKDENIILDDVKCTLHFISTSDTINSLVAWYPIRVTICNLEDKRVTESFEIYTKMLLTKNKNEYSYYALLNSVDTGEVICDIHIDITLREFRMNSNNYEEGPWKDNYVLDPIILDEAVIFQSLVDLESWKKSQKQSFEVYLQQIRTEELSTLHNQWKVKRERLETELYQRMERCRLLSNELSIATDDIRRKKQKLEANQVNERTTENIEIKVTKMLEEEMNQKISRTEKEKRRLMDKLEELKEENKMLHGALRAKDEETEEIKRSTLTKEQTTCLLHEIRTLEEKYQEAHNAKVFFKEQWQKAAKEAHALKSKDQKQIQREIRYNKEQLSQLSLENFDSYSDKDDNASSYSLPYFNHSDAGSCAM